MGRDGRQSGDPPSLQLRDETLPCAQHLDPDGTMLPTSEWIHVNGTIPICSLDQVLRSIQELLLEEEERGIIDLQADWNPVKDPFVPILPPSGGSRNDADGGIDRQREIDDAEAGEQDTEDASGASPSSLSPSPLIEAAHVVLSPYGRPNGWHIKLANR